MELVSVVPREELKALGLHAMDRLASAPNCKTLDLRFRALLGEGIPELCLPLDVCCVVEIEKEMTFLNCRYRLQ